ncbi:flagellar hook-basal body complex protein FliE [Oikeobacillus pervagus]|uniref:Flagellar hook-basal body complex protein FliE n=1 Tax=Oikeobacillus pervagus TaxID=1325931 RepID=A0AAJ1WI56_9BACI|nr:flagellar hook-basal body complex protein FliE [Oikeobacillus pervagus]MDQ0214305.1 flagellar hook-basal body complex protein FliE [Oikeobacillus pervagus]
MTIQSLNTVASPFFKTVSSMNGMKPSPNESGQKFASMLKDSIEKLNESQTQSDQMTEKLARGEKVDLHQVMITAQKASISLQLAVEIRNKAVEAYQEMMRMQV